MGYIGTPVQQALTKATSQYFNGTGSQTVFTLNRAVNVPEDLEVFVNNIQQEPGVGKSYTATGTTLTFDAAPSSGTGNIYVIYRGSAEVTRRLEHDPNAALAATTGTFSGNVDVTGNVTADGLDISGSSGATLTLTSTDTSGADTELLGQIDFVSSDVSGGSAGTQARIKGVYEDNGDSSGIAFLTGFSTGSGSPTLNEVMRIRHEGNVGIGTASPSQLLHLSSSSPRIRIDHTSGAIAYVDAATNGVLEFVADDTNVAANSSMRFKVDGSEVVRVQTGGFTLNPATSNLYQTSGALSYYGTTNNVYLNGASSGGMIMSGNGNRHQYVYLNSVSDSVAITTNTLERLGIDSSGRVTMPYQPAFRAVLITSTNTVGNYMVFESVDYNIGNHYNATTGVFTAPISGRYMVSVQGFNENNQNSQLYVRVNNANKTYSLSYAGASGSNQYNMMSHHTVFNLAANDTVRVFCAAGELYASSADSNSFSCYLLG